MKLLDKKELSCINGGFALSKWLIIGGIVSFVVGIISGQIKLKWQNHKNTEFKGNFEEKPLIRIRRKD